MNVTKLRAIVRKFGDAGTLYTGLCALVCLLACGVSAEGEGFAPPKKNPPAKRSKPYLPQKPLLPACIPLRKVGIRNEGVYWITNEKAILITRARDGAYRAPTVEEWYGKAELFNLRTRKTRLLKGLTAFLKQNPYPIFEFEPSPNSKWLKFNLHDSGTGFTTYTGTLEGTQYSPKYSDKWGYSYWMDGDRWVWQPLIRRAGKADEYTQQELYVYNLNGGFVENVSVHSPKGLEILHQFCTQKREVFEAASEKSGVSLSTYSASEYYLTPYSNDRQCRSVVIPAPRGIQAGNTAISPQGRKVALAYLCAAVSAKGRKEASSPLDIWVCSTDGFQLRELGYLDVPVGETKLQPVFSEFSWLPDSKSLSFVYKGTLYLLPVK